MINEDDRKQELRAQVKSRRSGPIRLSKGTPGRKVDDARAICGLCHNTGVQEIRGGGARRCPCGQAVLR